MYGKLAKTGINVLAVERILLKNQLIVKCKIRTTAMVQFGLSHYFSIFEVLRNICFLSSAGDANILVAGFAVVYNV